MAESKISEKFNFFFSFMIAAGPRRKFGLIERSSIFNVVKSKLLNVL